MNGQEAAEVIVAKPNQAARLLGGTRISGLSEAFLGHVLRLFAANHQRLIGLRNAAKAVIRYGDDLGPANRAYAIILRAQGKWKESADAFLQAGRCATNEKDKLSFQVGAIDCLARGGQLEEAIQLGRELVAGLSAIGEFSLADRAALNLAYALMEQDRYPESLEILRGGDGDSLARRLRRNGFETDAASAQLALSTCLLFGGEARDARDSARAAAETASEAELDLLGDIARGNAAYAELLLGNPDLAVAELLDLRRRHTGAPVEEARTLEYLGDAYTAMNLWPEAADAYREALAMGNTVSALHRAHLRLGLGQSLLAAGNYSAALTEVSNAARRYRSLGNLAWESAAQTEQAMAERALGRPHRRRIEGAVELARRSGSRFHLARALVVSAECAGDASALDEAAALVRRGNFGRLGWRIEAERARRTTGRTRRAHRRAMLRAILSDQAHVSSFAGRMSFLRDKEDALREYLHELLSQGKATGLQEALDVIAKTRSVALLDELLRARGEELPSTSVQKLEELRQSLNRGDSQSPTAGSRRVGPSPVNLDHSQRRWLEATYRLLSPTNSSIPIAADTAVVVQAGSEIHVLTQDKAGLRADRLPLSPGEIERRLRWLAYDLLAPMADRQCTGDRAMKQLCELGRFLVEPIMERGVRGICPDGVLFRLPWLACLDAVGREDDLELLVHPGFAGKDPNLSRSGALLWVASHDDLPNAEREATDFLKRFPQARVCRSAEEARRSLDGAPASVLHIISHAHHQVTHPMFSSLEFQDGPVLATEIARSNLRADLVTLSGCDTGRLSDVNRFEPDGLVRAFLACGAGYVVGSAWPLDDVAAVHLYEEFYRQLLSGANVHHSLRKARRYVQNWNEHPYFWASPLLYGGYRK